MEDSRRAKLLARIEKRKGLPRKMTPGEFLQAKAEQDKSKLMSWKEFAAAMGIPERPEING